METYIGQFQQGRSVSLLLCTTVTPDAAPTARIYADDGTYQSVTLPAIDAANGLFLLPMFLDLGFSLGRYRVCYRWSSGGQSRASLATFEVVAGGDPNGAVISLYYYDRPEARYVLAQLGAGKLVQGRSPRI